MTGVRWPVPGVQAIGPALLWCVPVAVLSLGAFWLGSGVSALLAPGMVSLRTQVAPDPVAAGGRIAARHWFGEVVQQVDAAPPLHVLGVFAPSSGQGAFAIVSDGGRSFPLLVGKPASNGWVLESVTGKGITLRSDEGTRFIPLENRSAGGGGAPVAGNVSGNPDNPDGNVQ